MTTRKTTLDAKALVGFFGGPKAMSQTWQTLGLSLSEAAVTKWIQRNTVPSARVAEALVVAKRLGRSIDLAQFVNEGRPV